MVFLKKNRAVFEAIATLMGATIGAGILGLPYAIKTVGFGIGVSLMIGVSLIITILELMYAELILRTRGDHEVPGYAGIYLGNSAKGVSVILGLLGCYGGLLAYLIGEGQVLQSLFGGNELVWVLGYFSLTGYVVYKGIDTIKEIETLFEIMVITVIVFLIAQGVSHVQWENLTYWSSENLLSPYGVLLFAFTGMSAIPQLHIQLRGREKSFPKAILSANIIILCLYIAFVGLVIGVLGKNITEVATVGLGQAMSPFILVIGNILAFFTMTTSYLVIATSMRRLFENDFKWSSSISLFATLGLPIALFLLGVRDFIRVLGLVGGVVLGAQLIIIIFSFWKARINGNRTPEFTIGVVGKLGVFFIIILLFGMIYSLRF